jgi:type II secretion system protein I
MQLSAKIDPSGDARNAMTARSGRSRRNGLSLLEVILAIAILGSAMAVIGNLFFLGYRSALQSRNRSDANILVDAKMAELAAGVIPAESVGSQSIEENPLWSYSVDVRSSDQLGLLIATVTVQQTDEAAAVPVSLSIVRFVPDPDYDPAEDEE